MEKNQVDDTADVMMINEVPTITSTNKHPPLGHDKSVPKVIQPYTSPLLSNPKESDVSTNGSIIRESPNKSDPLDVAWPESQQHQQSEQQQKQQQSLAQQEQQKQTSAALLSANNQCIQKLQQQSKLLCQPIITQSQLQQHIQDEIYIKSQLYDNGKAIRAHLQHQKLIHLHHHTPPKLKQQFINQLDKLETNILGQTSTTEFLNSSGGVW